jgi:hypothetical protein
MQFSRVASRAENLSIIVYCKYVFGEAKHYNCEAYLTFHESFLSI